ncbi:MAG TPA: hypothetical protein VLA00_18800 [Xanthobacteraceae bacterium]|nr:hypothetical protein [Xanthobacteraceae bacterium]
MADDQGHAEIIWSPTAMRQSGERICSKIAAVRDRMHRRQSAEQCAFGGAFGFHMRFLPRPDDSAKTKKAPHEARP